MSVKYELTQEWHDINQKIIDFCIEPKLHTEVSAHVGFHKLKSYKHLKYLIGKYLKRTKVPTKKNGRGYIYQTLNANYVPELLEFKDLNEDTKKYNFVPYKPEHMILDHNIEGTKYIATEYLKDKKLKSEEMIKDARISFYKRGAISSGGVEFV